MVNPIAFLWRQFNGPQITAVCNALFEYFRDMVDSNLSYLRKMSFETANTEHLTLLGILGGLARPLVPIPDESRFIFTDTYEYEEDLEHPGHLQPQYGYRGSKHGFADLNNLALGGVFDYDRKISGYSYISDFVFRGALIGSGRSKGQLGGLVALDDILMGIWRQEHPSILPVYRFEWARTLSVSQTPGDIIVDLGVTGDWAQAYETQAEVKLLGKTVYYPSPWLIPRLKEGESNLDPEGFIRILLHTDESTGVYGLDAMFEGTGTPSDEAPPLEVVPDFDVLPISISELQLMLAQDNSWIDEDAPTLEFQALTLDQIRGMF